MPPVNKRLNDLIFAAKMVLEVLEVPGYTDQERKLRADELKAAIRRVELNKTKPSLSSQNTLQAGTMILPLTNERALEAIKARINGEYDNPSLVKFGPLSTNTEEDILAIIDQVANKV